MGCYVYGWGGGARMAVTALEAAREAQMSAAEARQHAVGLGGRKFRVEGTPVGNSRFVYKATAERLKARYGGTVVNYRPRRLVSVYVEAARQLGDCPTCEARPGRPCLSARGRVRRPHKRRTTT